MNNLKRKQLLSVVISQILAVPAFAAVIGNINCGDTSGLISAINTANTTPDADEINLNVNNQANCVYPLTVVDNNAYGNNGLPSITDSLTINGNHSAIQRQDGSPNFRIIHVAETGNLTLKQLSVENGSATGAWHNGGGIFNRGELTLEDSTVSGNTADGGGGIYDDSYSTTTLTNSTVSGNTANRDGGGIFNTYSTIKFTNSTVSGNTANRKGGGIFNSAGSERYDLGSTVTLINSIVSENTADDGGGIFNYWDSTATLTNSTVSGNTASVNGGGIYNYKDSTAMLTNSTVSGNIADNGDGGGIYNYRDSTVTLINSMVSWNIAGIGGGIYNDSTITLTNSTISENLGGGIFNYWNFTATLTNSTVSGNTSVNGGGIYNYQSTATLTNSTVSGNTADWEGGGIFNYWGSTVTLTNSTVSGNTANWVGGGIYNSWYSTTTITNSTVSGNTARGDGGGIFNAYSTVDLTNSTVSGNTAGLAGGGIFNAYVTDYAALPNSTVSGNTESWNGGFDYYYYSTATLKNTILAGNTASYDLDCFNYDGIINANHNNLFGSNDSECNAGATDLTLTGLGITIDDVLKPTLANHGGSTQTLALVKNSPAIDAADNAVCPATDQRGVGRPQGATCDIGAFEYQPSDLVQLSHFQAVATPQGIRLQWQTPVASDNAGFRLFRANLDQYGGYTNITLLDYPQAQTLTATPLEIVTDWSHLIPAAASAGSGYSYLDTSAVATGMTYFYLLEDVNMGGYRTFHWDNIVSAVVGQNSEVNPQYEIK